MNIALKNFKSDIYNAIAPRKEFKMAIEYLSQIPKSRWISFISGNHESRIMREAGIDINEFLCRELEIEDIYSPMQCVTKVQLKNTSYWLHSFHGSGGGAMKGGKANKMERWANIVSNADVAISGHMHEQIHFTKAHYEIDKKHDTLIKKVVHCVNSGSCLGYRDGYAEGMGLAPAVKGNAILTLTNIAKQLKGITVRWKV
jgi:predicted phosphodiesterase